ncbi:DUF3147 family protein [Sphingomonas nostoxanthinifaciens]|uniref:DUF3147 family protein n=1 Tax=Sphingomonas nostoxanthinifaciens TaxID=2872652 RepID=UPI001CC1C5FD|nr:DUF3147 family protein [Sphingomonas nostoxanthinifaciens]UAK24525.1 DUF3147 family protein [Sphingomonas nostoxanthinifaciens]
MIQFWVRAALSGLIVAAIATIARRSPAAGALVASLPLLSLLGMIWLWHDTHDPARLAAHVEATFWYVLPSLPMFLVVPAALRHGVGFWPALAAGCALTILLYFITIGVAARFGVRL